MKKKVLLLTVIVACVGVLLLIIINNISEPETIKKVITYDDIILRQEDVDIEANKVSLQELCMIISTIIRSDTGLRNVYEPQKEEYVTKEKTEFYKRMCGNINVEQDNSYDAMMFNRYKSQAVNMTEINREYNDGRIQRICVWDYTENMWQSIITDYSDIEAEYVDSVIYMCNLGVIQLDQNMKIYPEKIVDEKYLTNIFSLLATPDELYPINCICLNADIPLLGFADGIMYKTAVSTINWLEENSGIINQFISFDMNGGNLSMCFATGKMGLLSLPLDWKDGTVFSFSTGKYNEKLISAVVGYCNDVMALGCIDIDKIINGIQGETFEGYSKEMQVSEKITITVSIFQIEDNSISVQCKLIRRTE